MNKAYVNNNAGVRIVCASPTKMLDCLRTVSAGPISTVGVVEDDSTGAVDLTIETLDACYGRAFFATRSQCTDWLLTTLVEASLKPKEGSL